uniref:Uncharacterized protein n=1 Tax=Periophthalmus magnuspinnatus TaxID=409849 RepID=A0A3B4ALB1_9GOBI
MRRNATKLVHGSYVEEAEFQDDVLVYDLVAQKDIKAATMERVSSASSQNNMEHVNKRTSPVKNTLASMLTATGKTVLETVNSIMSTRRRSEDAGTDDRIRIEVKDIPKSHYILTNGVTLCKNIFEIDNKSDYNLQYMNNLNAVVKPAEDNPLIFNGHTETESKPQIEATLAQVRSAVCDVSVSSDSFVFQYQELMRSLGAEPELEEFTDDIGSFRRRVRALRRRLQREEEEEVKMCEEVLSWEGGDEEGGEKVEEMEDEETKNNSRSGIPSTCL